MKMLPILVLFALAASASAEHEKRLVLLDVNVKKLPEVIEIPRINHIFINGPSRRGSMTLRNAKLIGGDKLQLSAKYDPINQAVYKNISVPTFSLVGDYCANLEHFNEIGDGTITHGKGFLNVTYTDFKMWDAKFDLKYHPIQKKYQLSYPTYHYDVASVGGEITGMVNAKTKEPWTVEDVVKSSRNRLLIIDIYLSLANMFIKRGYAKNLATGLLNSFIID